MQKELEEYESVRSAIQRLERIKCQPLNSTIHNCLPDSIEARALMDTVNRNSEKLVEEAISRLENELYSSAYHLKRALDDLAIEVDGVGGKPPYLTHDEWLTHERICATRTSHTEEPTPQPEVVS